MERREWADINEGKRKNNKLREPINTGEKVLVLSERLKKKDALGFLYKSATLNKPFFQKAQIFVIRKRVSYDNYYYYWIYKEGEDKMDNRRYIQQDLFALNNHFM